MPDLRFDPSKTVTFELALGRVHHQDGAPSACLIVPADALFALVRAAGVDAGHAFARALGASIGARIVERLGSAPSDDPSKARPSRSDQLRASSVEAVVEHLAGELAVGGFGALTLERWGRAVVLVVDGSPFGLEGDPLVEAILGGAAEAAFGPRATVTLLEGGPSRARFFLGGRAGIDKVRRWLAAGVPWGEALVRLHAPSEAPVIAPVVRGDA